MQALAHLGATVVDQDRAVLVDVHQRAGLVERRQVERDAELHRRHRQRPLGVLVGGVELRDLPRPPGHVRCRQHLVPRDARALGVPDRLAVRRLLALDVEVAAAQLEGVDPEQRRTAAEDVLDHQHPLGSAEAAEGGLRRLVGLRDAAVDARVGDPVGVVDVADRPGQHRLGEVEAPATVGGEGGVERQQAAVVVEADPPGRVEAVPLAGQGDVLRAGEPYPDRPAGQGRAERRHRGVRVGLRLLAAEAATHPQALHGDGVAGETEDVGDDLLGLGRVLGGRLHEHLAAVVDLGQRGLGLQVELLLPGHLGLTLEDVGGASQSLLDVPAFRSGQNTLEALGLDRLTDRQQRGERLVVDLDPAALPDGPPRGSRRAPSRPLGRGA